MRVQGENAELHDFDFTKLYNEAQLQSLAHSMFSRIWSWLKSVNGISCSIIVIYWILCGITYAVSVILNAITIYKTVGVSSLLTAALWNSLTQYTLFHRPHPPTVNHIHRSTTNTSDTDTQPERPTSPCPQPTGIIQPLPGPPLAFRSPIKSALHRSETAPSLYPKLRSVSFGPDQYIPD